MGFIAPIIGGLAGAAGSVAGAIGSGIGALAGGIGSAVGGIGSALGIGGGATGVGASVAGATAGAGSSILGGAGGLGGLGGLSSLLGGAGGSILGPVASSLIPTPQQQGAQGGQGGGSVVGNFLSNLVPVAAGLATDESGQLDVDRLDVLTPEQSELLKAFSLKATSELGREPSPFPGQLSAGATSLQQSLFGQLPGILQNIQKPISDIFSGDISKLIASPERALETFEGSIAGPARTGFLEELVPKITEPFVSQGTLGSSGFNRAITTQARKLEEGLASQRGLFVQDAERQRLQDLTSVSNLGQQSLQQLQTGLGFGEAERGIQQQGINASLSEFLRLNQIPSPALSAVTGAPLQTSAFDTLVQPGAPSPLNFGGFGQQLGGSLSSLFGGGGGSQFAPLPAQQQQQQPQFNQPNPYFASPFASSGFFA